MLLVDYKTHLIYLRKSAYFSGANRCSMIEINQEFVKLCLYIDILILTYRVWSKDQGNFEGLGLTSPWANPISSEKGRPFGISRFKHKEVVMLLNVFEDNEELKDQRGSHNIFPPFIL